MYTKKKENYSNAKSASFMLFNKIDDNTMSMHFQELTCKDVRGKKTCFLTEKFLGGVMATETKKKLGKFAAVEVPERACGQPVDEVTMKKSRTWQAPAEPFDENKCVIDCKIDSKDGSRRLTCTPRSKAGTTAESTVVVTR